VQSDTMKIGLIGCGNVGIKRHLPVLMNIEEVEVVAISDIDSQALDQVEKKFGIENKYHNYLDLLDNANVEVVAVCTPLPFHFEVALAALDAGKHVFIEKPLVTTLGEADFLIDKAVTTGNKVYVGFNKRWHHLVRRGREIVKNGLLGPVSVINCVYTTGHTTKALPDWRIRREKGGGSLIENGVHLYDLWRFLLRRDVVEVFAQSRSDVNCDDEPSVITAKTADGVFLNAVLSDLLPARHDMTILGRDCALNLYLDRFDGYELTPLGTCAGNIGNRIHRLQAFFKELPHAIHQTQGVGRYNASFELQWRHFLDCIRRDDEVGCSLEDGRYVVQVTLAATKSAQTGLPVRINEALDQ